MNAAASDKGTAIPDDHAQFAYVQRRVAKGDYRVDSGRVAEAILQRIGAIVLDRQISGRSDRALRRARTDRPEA